MKFLISIYGDDATWTSLPPEDLERLIAETDAHNKKLAAAGELLFACGTGEPGSVRRVTRTTDGETVVSEGPYLETKEYLGSFYIVDCADLERAQEIAAGMPSAKLTEIEVWPILHGGSADEV